jgi:hypothetical protein
VTRHDSQTWERFLWTSGGLLNLAKCAYYILAWSFDDEGRASYIPKDNIPSLRLTSGDDFMSEHVKHLNFNESHRYLGNRLVTGMQMTDAYQALLATATSYSSHLLCSSLSKRDTWVAYFAVFLPAMTYTLPVSHHIPKQLQTLQSPATRATLMKLGFNWNTAHRMVYGPSRYGGLGFRDLAVEQGIGQVELLVRHIRAGTTQGKLMRITLSWWQLVVGVSYPLPTDTSTTLPHPDSHLLSTL